MSLLDRLLARPRWQNSDPAVRAAAARDMGPDQHAVLLQLARTDPEAQVRRAALKKLADPELFAEAAKGDADPALRQEAAELLADVALGADGAAAERALSALDDVKHHVAVAREGKSESARRTALARLSDARSLAAVARHASDAAIRSSAVERLQDAALLADLALKSDHKEVALSALERVSDVEALEQVAARGKHKAAVKRAKARLAQLRPAAAPAAAPAPDHSARRAQICQSLEAVAGATDFAGAAERLAALVASWDTLDDDPTAELRSRYEAACVAVRERLERQEAEQDAARRVLSDQDRELTLRRSLIARVESLGGAGLPAGVDAVRAEWDALSAPSSPEAQEILGRFESAVKAARLRHERFEADRGLHDKLAVLAAEAEALLADPKGRRAGDVRKDWRTLASKVTPEPELLARFEKVMAELDSRSSAERRERAEQAGGNLKKVEEVLARVEAVAAGETVSLKDGDRALKDIRAALDDRAPLPTPADRERVVARLRDARTKLYPRVQELREAEEWKRWGNATAREELITRMEALAGREDLAKVDTEFRDIQGRWSQSADVSRTDYEALKQRWQAAREPVWQRLEVWRKERQAELEQGLEKKRQLVERAESLADSTEWVKTAQEVQKLQEEWKQSPPAPRRDSQELWTRFRTATSRFFERRKADLSEKKGEWAANLQKKEALCVRAEELAESTDWDAAAAELKKLQAEWKATGPVSKAKSDAVWKRFRAAADAFFLRYKKRGELEAEEAEQGRERLCREMESLADALAPQAADHLPPAPADLALRVTDVLERWSREGQGARRRGADKHGERLFAARDRLIAAHPEAFQGTDLDPAGNMQRMEKLIARVEELALTVKPAAPLDRDLDAATLAKLLRESLAARTMGAPSEQEARWSAAQSEVEQLQSRWRQLGPVPGPDGEALASRFKAAVARLQAAKPKS